MNRRELITGAAASALFADLTEAEAMSPGQRLVLLGGANPYIINKGLLSTSAFQSVFTAARTGTQCPALFMGDSLGLSYGSGATTTKFRQNAVQNKLSALLVSGGIKSVTQGWLANGNLHGTGTDIQYDDRQVNGAPAWGGGVNTLGGQSMLASAAATWTFTPSVQCDSFDLYYLQFGGAGHISYSIDGGAAVDINCNGTNTFKKRAITGLSLGNHTLTVAWVSGGTYFVGADAFDSTLVGLKWLNACINGGFSNDFTANTNYYDPIKAATALAPSLAFLLVGANHWNTDSGLSAFSSDLQTLATAYASICPLVLISDIPSDPAAPFNHAAFATQQQYVDAMVSVARQNNLVMFDEWRKFGGASANFDSRWLAADHIHGTATGYQQIAQDMATAMLAA